MGVNELDVPELFQEFLKLRKMADSSIECYMRYYRELQREIIDKIGLEQLAINKWLGIHKNHTQIRAFLKSYLEFIDDRTIRLYRATGRANLKRERPVPTNEEVKAIIEDLLIRNEKFGIIIAIIYDCALRRTEVLNIQRNDLKLNAWRKIRKESGDRIRGRLIVRGKGNKQRSVWLDSSIMELLEVYLARNPVKSNTERIFKTNRTSLTQAYHKACRRALGRRYRLHDLRKSKATRWNREGKTLEQIKIRLGHDSIKTTELYIKPDVDSEMEIWKNE